MFAQTRMFDVSSNLLLGPIPPDFSSVGALNKSLVSDQPWAPSVKALLGLDAEGTGPPTHVHHTLCVCCVTILSVVLWTACHSVP